MLLYRKFQNGSSTRMDSVYAEYPGLKKLGDVTLVEDTSFTKAKTGVGDIEFFPETGVDTVRYPTGYKYAHPNPGTTAIVMNPATNNYMDVIRDLLHISGKDSIFDSLKSKFRTQTKKDEAEDIQYFYNQEVINGGAEDGYKQWLQNYADGKLRSEFDNNPKSDYAIDRKYNSVKMKEIADKIKAYLKK